jgi:hypothetical protein
MLRCKSRTCTSMTNPRGPCGRLDAVKKDVFTICCTYAGMQLGIYRFPDFLRQVGYKETDFEIAAELEDPVPGAAMYAENGTYHYDTCDWHPTHLSNLALEHTGLSIFARVSNKANLRNAVSLCTGCVYGPDTLRPFEGPCDLLIVVSSLFTQRTTIFSTFCASTRPSWCVGSDCSAFLACLS